MKKLLLLILILLPMANTASRAQNVDSLITVLNEQKLSYDEIIALYQDITRAYMAQHDFDKVFEYAKPGLTLAGKEKDKKQLANFHNYLGTAYYFTGVFDTAQMHLEKSLESAEAIGDRCRQSIALSSLGNLNYSQDKFTTALEYYLQSLPFAEEEEDKISTYCNIALIYRTLEDIEHANTYLLEALEVAERSEILGDSKDYMLAFIHDNLGSNYGSLKDYEKSKFHYDEALVLARKIGNRTVVASSLAGLAAYYAQVDDSDKALEYALEGMHIAEETGVPNDIYSSYILVSDLYREAKMYGKSEELAMRAWDMDSLSVRPASHLAGIIAIDNIYLGNKGKAEKFIRNQRNLLLQGNSKSLHNSLTDMETRYETEKKEIRIAALEKERRLYIWLGAAGALLAVALGIGLWLKIKSDRKERQLIATRSVLDGEMAERTRLARDLHDRLSGNLAAVKTGLNNAEALQKVCEKLDGCIEEVRRVAHNLMPVSLQLSLKAALEDFAAQFPNVHFHFFGEERRLEERLEFVVYCCAGELINNALRHSGAANINVQLIQAETHISLTVQDDGCGISDKKAAQGAGLKNIRDRVASCDGKIDIVSAPGKGTEITIELETGKKA